MNKYLDIWNLEKTYAVPGGSYVVLQDFNLSVEEGEVVSLIGHSGCGKSTVLSMIAGLTSPSSGVMILSGKEIVGAGADRGVVFQAPCLFEWLTAAQNVTLGLSVTMPNASRRERHEIAAHYLDMVGLGSELNKRPNALSMGMRQRVSIARAFALRPKMLLLDEPFGMLDSITRVELQDVLLRVWSEEKRTLLLVTHDVDEALFLSDRVVMMTRGPAARVGGILEVGIDRPRRRASLVDSPRYETLRNQVLTFLETNGESAAGEAFAA